MKHFDQLKFLNRREGDDDDRPLTPAERAELYQFLDQFKVPPEAFGDAKTCRANIELDMQREASSMLARAVESVRTNPMIDRALAEGAKQATRTPNPSGEPSEFDRSRPISTVFDATAAREISRTNPPSTDFDKSRQNSTVFDHSRPKSTVLDTASQMFKTNPPSADPDASDETAEGCDELSPRQLAAVELLVRGRSFAAASRELGIHRQTVAAWARLPEFRAAVQERVRNTGSAWHRHFSGGVFETSKCAPSHRH
jgi:hypothetical protein